MRISDGSADLCSSDLLRTALARRGEQLRRHRRRRPPAASDDGNPADAQDPVDGLRRERLSAARLDGRRRMTGAVDLRRIGRVAGAAALPLGMLILVALMVIPVSPLVLDISFVGNIMISLAIQMVELSASKPLDFSDRKSTRLNSSQ